MTEILLLGTFHFLESPLNFYSADIQSQLEALTQKLKRFKPDAIALEASAKSQKTIDKSYHKFSLYDLSNCDFMKSNTLGSIKMFGSVYPITYNNESVQIGFRLGKLLDLPQVYAIDDDTDFDMSVMDNKNARLESAKIDFQTDISANQPQSIIELYRYYNSSTWSKLSHNVYIQANSINTNGTYDGSLMVTKWYERNLKIFSNIQNLSVNSKKLFILYGAGHLQILSELIKSDSNLKLVDVNEYL